MLVTGHWYSTAKLLGFVEEIKIVEFLAFFKRHAWVVVLHVKFADQVASGKPRSHLFLVYLLLNTIHRFWENV